MNYGDMTVRQFLKSAQSAYIEAMSYQVKAQALRERCESITSQWKDVPGGGGGSVQKDSALVYLADCLAGLEAARAVWLSRCAAVDSFVQAIEPLEQRIILELRYLNNLKWDAVMIGLQNVGLYYSEREMYYLHGRALKTAEKLWEELHEDCNSEQEDQ